MAPEALDDLILTRRSKSQTISVAAAAMGANAMPPLGRYLADESIAAPKGRGPPDPWPFFPANQPFRGGQEWGP
jgi:hypothetical protein